MLENEVKTFEQELPNLLKSDVGKFALVKETQIVGVFAAIADALSYGYEKFKEKPFFVREITPVQEPFDFSYHRLFC